MTGGAACHPAAASALPGASPAGGAGCPLEGPFRRKRGEARRGLGPDHRGQEWGPAPAWLQVAGLALQVALPLHCPLPWQLMAAHLASLPQTVAAGLPARSPEAQDPETRTVCQGSRVLPALALRTVCALSHGPWRPEHMNSTQTPTRPA